MYKRQVYGYNGVKQGLVTTPSPSSSYWYTEVEESKVNKGFVNQIGQLALSGYYADWTEPVSYTHLDVYKRQSKGWLPGLFRSIVNKAKDFLQNLIREHDMPPKPVLEIDMAEFRTMQKPVSYTHLDVYKRQAFISVILTRAGSGLK